MMISIFYLIHKKLDEEIQINIGNDVLFIPKYTNDRCNDRRINEILKIVQEDIALPKILNCDDLNN